MLMKMAVLDVSAFGLAGSLGFISFCVNPLIYASRYEVFRRYLKQMFNKNSVTPTNGIATITQPANTHRL